MSEPSNLLQSYSAPTCTLEVVGEPSALSQWTSGPVLKGVRFRLSIKPWVVSPESNNQPEQAKDILLRGDRRQLESLVATVQTYVQEQLVAAGDSPNQAEANRPPAEPVRQSISLHPQGLTRHRLQAAGLLDDRTEDAIVLNSLQLADLATVIDRFDSSAIALPPLVSTQQRRQRWWTGRTSVGSAAAVVIMAISVATIVPQVWQNSGSISNLSTSESDVEGERQVTPPAAADGPEDNPETISEEQAVAQAEPGATSDSITPSTGSPLPGNATASGSRAATPAPKAASSADERPANTETRRQRENTSPNQSASRSSNSPSSRSAQPEIIQPEDSVASQAAAPAPPNDQSFSTASEAAPAGPPAPESPFEFSTASPEAATGAITGDANDSGASTALEAVPMMRSPQAQANEVRQFFVDRWQPQSDLSASLIYELQINPDGTLSRITPMNQTAILHSERIALPESGRAIASPSSSQVETLFRLELIPNGQVEVTAL